MLVATSHIQEKREDILEAREKQGMKLKVLVKLGLLLFLLGFTATTVDATRFDPSSFNTQVLPNPKNNGDAKYYYVKSRATACCDE